MFSLPLPQLVIEKADASHIQDMGVQMFMIQEQLAGLQTRLEGRYQTKVEAEAQHQQAQDQLEAMKTKYSSTVSRDSKARANSETCSLNLLFIISILV